METILVIAVGGALGAVLRHLTAGWVATRTDHPFPLATLLINVVGCFLIGFLGHLFERSLLPAQMRALLIVGILGAFTTFSTFGAETITLFRSGQIRLALVYVVTSNLCGLAAVLVGFYLARMIPR